MSKGSWKFVGKGLSFLAVGSATLLLAYKIQQIKFEFGQSSCTLADAEEIVRFLLETKNYDKKSQKIDKAIDFSITFCYFEHYFLFFCEDGIIYACDL